MVEKVKKLQMASVVCLVIAVIMWIACMFEVGASQELSDGIEYGTMIGYLWSNSLYFKWWLIFGVAASIFCAPLGGMVALFWAVTGFFTPVIVLNYLPEADMFVLILMTIMTQAVVLLITAPLFIIQALLSSKKEVLPQR